MSSILTGSKYFCPDDCVLLDSAMSTGDEDVFELAWKKDDGEIGYLKVLPVSLLSLSLSLARLNIASALFASNDGISSTT